MKTELKTTYLDRLWETGKKFLGVTYPIICGAMTWISEHRLVSAVSECGAFGVLAAGNSSEKVLRDQILKTRQATARPFGVNLIMISPNFESHLEVALSEKVPVIIFAGGIPSTSNTDAVSRAGLKAMAFAPTVSVAKMLVKHGIGALILEGSEAGGHIGPVSTSVLAQEILPEINEVPIFLAGGIATGAMIAHYLLMGAAGCQLGTRFVVAKECRAHERVKARFIKASARDSMPTPHFGSMLPVLPVRALINDGTKEFYRLQVRLISELDDGTIGRDDAQRRVEEFWVGGLRRALLDGDIERGSLMAGQGVGMVSKIQSVKEIVEELIAQAEMRLTEIAVKLSASQ